MAKWCLVLFAAFSVAVADASAQSLESGLHAGISFGRITWDDDTIDWRYDRTHISGGWEQVLGDRRSLVFEGSLADRDIELLSGDWIRNSRVALLTALRFYGSLERRNPVYGEAGLAFWALTRCVHEVRIPFGGGFQPPVGCGNTSLDPSHTGFRYVIGAGVRVWRFDLGLRHHFAGSAVYRGGGFPLSEATTEVAISLGMAR